MSKPAPCPNCGKSQHRRCCARCGRVHRVTRWDFQFCTERCARAQAIADAAPVRIERETEDA